MSWEPDLWGSIRRGVTASTATAESMAANVGNARLLFQAELAQDYFGLHGLDAEVELLARTEASYTEFLTLTQNRFSAGIASDLDVAQAETQLYAVQAQLMDLGVQRAAFEHAIAILIGKAPAELTIPPATLTRLSAAGAAGGSVRASGAKAGHRQRGAAGGRGQRADWDRHGGLLPEPELDGKRRVGQLEPGQMVHVAQPLLVGRAATGGHAVRCGPPPRRSWRNSGPPTTRPWPPIAQTVLTAMQQVEDNLAALRILSGEADKVQQTVQSATRALDISSAQYRAGTASYLTVITSQATLLTAEVTAVTLLTRRLTASVLLIEALGGGWNPSQFPTEQNAIAQRR